MWEVFYWNIEWCNLAKIQLSIKSKSNLPLLKLFPFTLAFKFTLFLGHFIVVCGYHKVKKLIYYMNPNDSHGKFSAITIVLLNFLEEMQLSQVWFKVFSLFLSEEICSCSMELFDIARKRYGTDEDLLFIYKDWYSHMFLFQFSILNIMTLNKLFLLLTNVSFNLHELKLVWSFI